MGDYPGAAWLTQYRERVNGDPELNVIGEWFSTTFTLTFGDSRYALKIDKGKIVDIIAASRLDVRAGFGFAAPVAVWEKAPFTVRDGAPASSVMVPSFVRSAVVIEAK